MAVEAARSASHRITDALRFAFSILVTGACYQQISQVMLWNDIIPPSETTFYRCQKIVFRHLETLARRSLNLAAMYLEPGTIIAFDGSWSHRRHAKECIIVVIQVGTNKIIDYEVVRQPKRGVRGNWEGSSQGMEVQGLKAIISRLKNNPNIAGYVHDNDSAASKAIRDAQWNITEYFDPNHVSKCYDRRWDKAPKGALKGLGKKLKKWFNFLIHADLTDDQKKAYWANAVEHFKGNHKNCPKGHSRLPRYPQMDNPEAEKQLNDFISKTMSLVTRTRNDFHTQMCESFNAIKANFANKIRAWQVSWEFRMACAVLQVNDPLHWRQNLAMECELTSISSEAMEILQKRAREIYDFNAARREKAYQEKEKKRRAKVRAQIADNKLGSNDYGNGSELEAVFAQDDAEAQRKEAPPEWIDPAPAFWAQRNQRVECLETLEFPLHPGIAVPLAQAALRPPIVPMKAADNDDSDEVLADYSSDSDEIMCLSAELPIATMASLSSLARCPPESRGEEEEEEALPSGEIAPLSRPRPSEECLHKEPFSVHSRMLELSELFRRPPIVDKEPEGTVDLDEESERLGGEVPDHDDEQGPFPDDASEFDSPYGIFAEIDEGDDPEEENPEEEEPRVPKEVFVMNDRLIPRSILKPRETRNFVTGQPVTVVPVEEEAVETMPENAEEMAIGNFQVLNTGHNTAYLILGPVGD
jgi:hypothetical protein